MAIIVKGKGLCLTWYKQRLATTSMDEPRQPAKKQSHCLWRLRGSFFYVGLVLLLTPGGEEGAVAAGYYLSRLDGFKTATTNDA